MSAWVVRIAAMRLGCITSDDLTMICQCQQAVAVREVKYILFGPPVLWREEALNHLVDGRKESVTPPRTRDTAWTGECSLIGDFIEVVS